MASMQGIMKLFPNDAIVEKPCDNGRTYSLILPKPKTEIKHKITEDIIK